MTLQELKDKGEAPEFLTDEAYNMLQGSYLQPNETPKEMYQRVAKYASSNLKRPDLEGIFFKIVWDNWLCPSTPVLANSGTKSLPISCYAGTSADDTESLLDHVKEMGLLTKYGGGVGSYFGDIRAKGSPISSGGTTDGIVPFLKILESTIDGIKQGSSRRGAVASYLPFSHSEASEFIELRRPTGDLSKKCLTTAFHNAITISDSDMNDIISNSKNRDLFNKLMNMRVETGEPYIMFTDNANKNCPENYKGRIQHSNLCLSGDTLIATKEYGAIKIEDLVGKEVTIFDGKEWVKNSNFRQTNDSATLYRVHFNNGYVDCTEKHRWFKVDSNVATETKDLAIGDLIETMNEQVVYVDSIEKLEGTHKTYCTTVESTSKFGLANGLMTGNCSEIFLPTSYDETFVCCLSSLNLSRYDEWKDWKHNNMTLVELSIYFLDGIMSGFIEQASKISCLEKVTKFSKRHRALGLGALGWHTLLQRRLLPFESFQAMSLNNEVFSKIRREADNATRMLAQEFGECEETLGTGRRNTVTLAIAPNMSSSVISGGSSQGIEPLTANLVAQRGAKGTFIKKNKQLQELLASLNRDTPEVWDQINTDKGSVINLKFLSDEEKQIFATAREINQFSLVKQAAQRQKYIDQGQSINLFFSIPSNKDDNKAVARYINNVHIEAWKLGLKSLYYLKTDSPIKGVSLTKESSDCVACEG